MAELLPERTRSIYLGQWVRIDMVWLHGEMWEDDLPLDTWATALENKYGVMMSGKRATRVKQVYQSWVCEIMDIGIERWRELLAEQDDPWKALFEAKPYSKARQTEGDTERMMVMYGPSGSGVILCVSGCILAGELDDIGDRAEEWGLDGLGDGVVMVWEGVPQVHVGRDWETGMVDDVEIDLPECGWRLANEDEIAAMARGEDPWPMAEPEPPLESREAEEDEMIILRAGP